MRTGRHPDIDPFRGGTPVTTPAGTPVHPQSRITGGLSIGVTGREGRNDDALLLSPWPQSLSAPGPVGAPLAGHAPVAAIGPAGSCRCGRRDDLLSPPATGELAVPRAQAALRLSGSGRRRLLTGFAAAPAAGGAAAGAATGRDAP
jgi:hypothetical protein